MASAWPPHVGDGELAVGGVLVVLGLKPVLVGQHHHVEVRILVIEVPLLTNARIVDQGDRLIDVLRAPDELPEGVLRSVADLDELWARVIVILRAVAIARVGDHFLDPPTGGVVVVSPDRSAVVAGLDRDQPIPGIVFILVPGILGQVAVGVLKTGDCP